MRIFGSERIGNMMKNLGLKEGEAIEHPWISRAIENAQKKVEGRNFEIRKHLLKYDNVMNVQRSFIYKKRNELLREENLKTDILDALKDVLEWKSEQYCPEPSHSDSWDIENFNKFLFTTFGTKIDPTELDMRNISFAEFLQRIIDHLTKIYTVKEQQITEEIMRQIERAVMLQVIDGKWKEHLYAMDHLKEGISWRAMGERDPLVEYKFEGFRIFEEMVNQVKLNSMELLFKLDPDAIQQEVLQARAMEMRQQPLAMGKEVHSEFGQFDALRETAGTGEGQQAPGPQAQQQVKRAVQKVGRNEPCWCGSGKKYKHCHGKLE
jgi:preprotein translocase subunit SecA